MQRHIFILLVSFFLIPYTFNPILSNDIEKVECQSIKLKTIKSRMNLALPIDSMIITSQYGFRNDPFTKKKKFHSGIDLAGDYNYVYSIMPGFIIKSGESKSWGKYVEVNHGKFKTLYAHLSKNLVKKNQYVKAGEVLGISGSTGRSTGEHLHFQISFNGKVIDPNPILNYIKSVRDLAKKEIANLISNLEKSQ